MHFSLQKKENKRKGVTNSTSKINNPSRALFRIVNNSNAKGCNSTCAQGATAGFIRDNRDNYTISTKKYTDSIPQRKVTVGGTTLTSLLGSGNQGGAYNTDDPQKVVKVRSSGEDIKTEFEKQKKAYDKAPGLVAKPYEYGQIVKDKIGEPQDSDEIPEGSWGIVMEKLETVLKPDSKENHPPLIEIIATEVDIALETWKLRQELIKNGIHHNDVKQHNVGRSKDGKLKTYDFGVASDNERKDLATWHDQLSKEGSTTTSYQTKELLDGWSNLLLRVNNRWNARGTITKINAELVPRNILQIFIGGGIPSRSELISAVLSATQDAPMKSEYLEYESFNVMYDLLKKSLSNALTEVDEAGESGNANFEDHGQEIDKVLAYFDEKINLTKSEEDVKRTNTYKYYNSNLT
ncbi:hypothetical protein [Pseudoalteromonas obscura]|uniref:Protein kinase domain-containing protein n=1 Tax=Pseudoalteromonas obscura TaxID=3048491 RepID=A0ABT7EJS1_9GAMM|nr:hypothetical protein [Pseudoalteromonas sp. P94(2023)]MDK2595290.1 hypothetical protein [Pseudoalteromonas sp. P94(2023)]